MTPCEKRLVTPRDELRPVQGRTEDTDERVMTSHTEKSEVTSVEEGHDVEFENCANADESVLVREFDQVEGGACVLGDQRRRNGEDNQFFASKL